MAWLYRIRVRGLESSHAIRQCVIMVDSVRESRMKVEKNPKVWNPTSLKNISSHSFNIMMILSM